MMEKYHRNGVHQPLHYAEITESEFIDLKIFCSRNHSDDSVSQSANGYTRKCMDSAGILKYIDAPAEQKTKCQKQKSVFPGRIKKYKQYVNIGNRNLLKHQFVKQKDLYENQKGDQYDIE